MNHTQFKRAREEVGFGLNEFARLIDTDPRTVRRWQEDPQTSSTARAPNPIACKVLEWLASGELKPRKRE